MSRDGCYEQAHSNKDTRSEPAVSGAVRAGHGELQRQGYALLTPALPGLPALPVRGTVSEEEGVPGME